MKKEQRLFERESKIKNIYGKTALDFKRFKINMNFKRNKSTDQVTTVDSGNDTLNKTAGSSTSRITNEAINKPIGSLSSRNLYNK